MRACRGSTSVLEQDLYKVLQVDVDAEQDVIAAAYKVLARKLHPEKDLTGLHEVWLAALNRAYATLKDPAARRAYNARRTAELIPVGPGEDPKDYHRLSGGALTERLKAGPNGVHVDTLTIGFGRYAGWTLGAVARTDPEYLRWLSRHSSGIRYRAAILTLLSELGLQDDHRAVQHGVPQHVDG